MMRAWRRRRDSAAAAHVDELFANSHYVASRIRRHYGGESTVIYPPVDTDFFTPSESTQSTQPTQSDADESREGGDFYLVVSRLVPYKRVDVAVEAFNRLGRPLVIVGDGPKRRRLQAMDRHNNTLAGSLSDLAVSRYSRHVRLVVI